MNVEPESGKMAGSLKIGFEQSIDKSRCFTGVGKGESLNQGEFEFDPESGKIAGSLKIGFDKKMAREIKTGACAGVWKGVRKA